MKSSIRTTNHDRLTVKVERFIAGLYQLKAENKFTATNIAQLLKAGTTPPAYAAGCLFPEEYVLATRRASPEARGRRAAMPAARSEMRRAFEILRNPPSRLPEKSGTKFVLSVLAVHFALTFGVALAVNWAATNLFVAIIWLLLMAPFNLHISELLLLDLQMTRPARILPEVSFPEGIPETQSSVVTYAFLPNSREEIEAFIQSSLRPSMEGNKDKNIKWIILSASGPELVQTEIELYGRVQEKYGRDKVLFIHRDPASKNWDKKRGGLIHLQLWLTRSLDPSGTIPLSPDFPSAPSGTRVFDHIVGDINRFSGLQNFFVADSDTYWHSGAVKTLISKMAHPANQAYTIFMAQKHYLNRAASRLTYFSNYFATLFRDYQKAHWNAFGQVSWTGWGGGWNMRRYLQEQAGKLKPGMRSHDIIESYHFSPAALVLDARADEEVPANPIGMISLYDRWFQGNAQSWGYLLQKMPSESGAKVTNSGSLVDQYLLILTNKLQFLSAFFLLFNLVSLIGPMGFISIGPSVVGYFILTYGIFKFVGFQSFKRSLKDRRIFLATLKGTTFFTGLAPYVFYGISRFVFKRTVGLIGRTLRDRTEEFVWVSTRSLNKQLSFGEILKREYSTVIFGAAITASMLFLPIPFSVAKAFWLYMGLGMFISPGVIYYAAKPPTSAARSEMRANVLRRSKTDEVKMLSGQIRLVKEKKFDLMEQLSLVTELKRMLYLQPYAAEIAKHDAAARLFSKMEKVEEENIELWSLDFPTPGVQEKSVTLELVNFSEKSGFGANYLLLRTRAETNGDSQIVGYAVVYKDDFKYEGSRIALHVFAHSIREAGNVRHALSSAQILRAIQAYIWRTTDQKPSYFLLNTDAQIWHSGWGNAYQRASFWIREGYKGGEGDVFDHYLETSLNARRDLSNFEKTVIFEHRGYWFLPTNEEAEKRGPYARKFVTFRSRARSEFRLGHGTAAPTTRSEMRRVVELLMRLAMDGVVKLSAARMSDMMLGRILNDPVASDAVKAKARELIVRLAGIPDAAKREAEWIQFRDQHLSGSAAAAVSEQRSNGWAEPIFGHLSADNQAALRSGVDLYAWAYEQDRQIRELVRTGEVSQAVKHAVTLQYEGMPPQLLQRFGEFVFANGMKYEQYLTQARSPDDLEALGASYFSYLGQEIDELADFLPAFNDRKFSYQWRHRIETELVRRGQSPVVDRTKEIEMLLQVERGIFGEVAGAAVDPQVRFEIVAHTLNDAALKDSSHRQALEGVLDRMMIYAEGPDDNPKTNLARQFLEFYVKAILENPFITSMHASMNQLLIERYLEPHYAESQDVVLVYLYSGAERLHQMAVALARQDGFDEKRIIGLHWNRRIAAKSPAELQRYLKESGILGHKKIVIVDSGFQGSVAEALLEHLTPQQKPKAVIRLFAMNSDIPPSRKKLGFNQALNEDKHLEQEKEEAALFLYAFLMDSFFPRAYQSAAKLEERGDRLEPVLVPTELPWTAKLVQERYATMMQSVIQQTRPLSPLISPVSRLWTEADFSDAFESTIRRPMDNEIDKLLDGQMTDFERKVLMQRVTNSDLDSLLFFQGLALRFIARGRRSDDAERFVPGWHDFAIRNINWVTSSLVRINFLNHFEVAGDLNHLDGFVSTLEGGRVFFNSLGSTESQISRAEGDFSPGQAAAILNTHLQRAHNQAGDHDFLVRSVQGALQISRGEPPNLKRNDIKEWTLQLVQAGAYEYIFLVTVEMGTGEQVSFIAVVPTNVENSQVVINEMFNLIPYRYNPEASLVYVASKQKDSATIIYSAHFNEGYGEMVYNAVGEPNNGEPAGTFSLNAIHSSHRMGYVQGRYTLKIISAFVRALVYFYDVNKRRRIHHFTARAGDLNFRPLDFIYRGASHELCPVVRPLRTRLIALRQWEENVSIPDFINYLFSF